MSEDDIDRLAPVKNLITWIERVLEGHAIPQFEDRALDLLSEIWETPLAKVSDFPDGRPLELRLGHFAPDLSERVAGLLEEAGR